MIRITLICFVLCGCITAGLCYSRTPAKGKLIKIEMANFEKWKALTRGTITRQNIWDCCNDTRTVIENDSTLKFIAARVSSLKKGKKSDNIEVRLSCILHYEGSVDTLSFGWLDKMQLNDKIYPTDIEMVSSLMKASPSEKQRAMIEEYLQKREEWNKWKDGGGKKK